MLPAILSLLPLLPLATALHVPSPQDAFRFADSLLTPDAPSHVLQADNEMRLNAVGDETVTIASPLHPVSCAAVGSPQDGRQEETDGVFEG
jgi:hypothetical protein